MLVIVGRSSAGPEHGAVARMVEHGLHLVVEMEQRHRGAGHLERGAIVADPGRMDRDADLVEPLLRRGGS